MEEAAWLQRFTPRAKKSIWSKINRQESAGASETGLMKPAGLKEIERARNDGRSAAAYDSPRGATSPDDFQAALDGNARAKAFFGSLDRGNRHAILRIQTVKKAETRAKRIRQFISMLENHEKIHPLKEPTAAVPRIFSDPRSVAGRCSFRRRTAVAWPPFSVIVSSTGR